MLSEHNPIAELISKIQQKWITDASPYPELKIVRWMIKPEEARLFEGFLKLESTEHGKIPEVLVAMLTPFKSEKTFSSDLIKDWMEALKKDQKTFEKLNIQEKATEFERNILVKDEDFDEQLINMLSVFHTKMIGKSLRLVIALFPHTIYEMDGFKRWMVTLLKKGLPPEVTFMIFDHIGQNYFDAVFNKFPEFTKSLHINLDLDGAVSKIAKMGDPNSPEVKFRECILEMGQSLQKNDQQRLDVWGQKGLFVTQKSGLKSLYASAHIVYAGMLFNYKQFSKIDSLLQKGLVIAEQGLKQEGPSCKPLLIQFHGYIAASYQLQKKIPEAIAAYEKQGDLSLESQLPPMALTPYRQAYTLSKKNLPKQHDVLIQKAFSIGQSMSKEEQTNSCFSAIAYDYLKWHEDNYLWEKAKQVDVEMKKIFGDEWKEQAKNTGATYSVNTQKPAYEVA